MSLEAFLLKLLRVTVLLRFYQSTLMATGATHQQAFSIVLVLKSMIYEAASSRSRNSDFSLVSKFVRASCFQPSMFVESYFECHLSRQSCHLMSSYSCYPAIDAIHWSFALPGSMSLHLQDYR